MSQYEIFKGKQDKLWYWRLVDKRGNVVAASGGHKRRGQAVRAAEKMPDIAQTTAISEKIR